MEPDTWGMVQDAPAAVEERLQRIEPRRPRTDQNDILIVENIDVGCAEKSYDTIRVTEKWRDPDPEARRVVVTRLRDITNLYDHSEGFTVKLSNHPFMVPPGRRMRLPRYIGEHFASKLADHMLDKLGVQGTPRMHPIERPAMLKRIIISEEPFAAMVPTTVGEQAAAEVANLNQTPIEGDADPVVAPFVAPGSDAKSHEYNDGQKPLELHETDTTSDASNSVQTTVGNISRSEIEPTDKVVARLVETAEDEAGLSEKWQKVPKADIIKLIRDMVPDYQFGSNLSKAQLAGILERM